VKLRKIRTTVRHVYVGRDWQTYRIALVKRWLLRADLDFRIEEKRPS
jgi:hypothetical protein